LNTYSVKNRINSFLQKRVFAILLSLALLAPVVCATSLVGLCYIGQLTGDTKAYIGSSFTVNLTLDEAAEGCMGYLEYDSSVLEIANVESGDKKLEEDFFYDEGSGLLIVDYTAASKKMAMITFTVLDDAAAGSTTSIYFTDWEVINGFDSEYMDDLSFNISLAEPDIRYTAKLTGDSEAQQGESFTLRLVLDNGAFGYRGVLSYDSSVLKLTKIAPVNGDLKENSDYDSDTGLAVVTHTTRVTKMLKVTFAVKDSAKVGNTKISFTSGEALNGSRATAVNDASATVKITKKKSADATLKSLSVKVFSGDNDRDGSTLTLEPSFSSDTMSYNGSVSNECSSFKIDAVCSDSAAKVLSATEGSLNEGMNIIAIKVRAEDGTEKTYTINLLREEVPEVSQESSEDTSSDPGVSEEESDVSEEDSSREESEESEDIPGFVGGSSSDASPEESSEGDDSSDENSGGFVLFTINRKTLIVIGVIAGVVLVLLLWLIVQWKRVAKRKSLPVKEDHALACKAAIEEAKSNLKNGLIRSFRAEFGDRIPEDTKALHQFVLSAYSQRMGSPYVTVENLMPYLQKVSGISLRGIDSVGGAYVLPVVTSETGAKCFRMEGLIITFKSGNFQHSETCHLRIHADKVGQPIEEVLDFES